MNLLPENFIFSGGGAILDLDGIRKRLFRLFEDEPDSSKYSFDSFNNLLTNNGMLTLNKALEVEKSISNGLWLNDWSKSIYTDLTMPTAPNKAPSEFMDLLILDLFSRPVLPLHMALVMIGFLEVHKFKTGAETVGMYPTECVKRALLVAFRANCANVEFAQRFERPEKICQKFKSMRTAIASELDRDLDNPTELSREVMLKQFTVNLNLCFNESHFIGGEANPLSNPMVFVSLVSPSKRPVKHSSIDLSGSTTEDSPEKDVHKDGGDDQRFNQPKVSLKNIYLFLGFPLE